MALEVSERLGEGREGPVLVIFRGGQRSFAKNWLARGLAKLQAAWRSNSPLGLGSRRRRETRNGAAKKGNARASVSRRRARFGMRFLFFPEAGWLSGEAESLKFPKNSYEGFRGGLEGEGRVTGAAPGPASGSRSLPTTPQALRACLLDKIPVFSAPVA